MIFKTPTTREERQKLLQILNREFANSPRYLDSQAEFMSLFNTGSSERFYTHGVGKRLGQFLNAYNSPTATDAGKRSALNMLSQQVGDSLQEILNKQRVLEELDAIGFLNPEEAGKFNGLVETLKEYIPEVISKVRPIQTTAASTSGEDFVSQVTGEKNVFGDRMANPVPAAAGQTNQPVAQFAGTGNPKVDALVDKVLATPNQSSQNLGSYDWWKSAVLPDREAAYAQIQKITSSPQTMADYVKSKGLINLQSFDWWSASPFKQDAWRLIEQSAAQGQSELPKGDAGIDEVDGAAGATSTPSASTDMSYQKALENLENNPDFQNLPESLKSMYREVLKNYDYNKEINIDGVLQEFNRIKTETIDPRFAKEIEKFTNELQGELNFQAQEREMQLETERANAGQSIRQAREGLSASGMTFTGKAIQELGKDSAYAQEGASTIPTQTPFGGLFYEGNVNQANRLMSSSSALRYKKNLELLGQSAENALGAVGAVKQNIAGFTPNGNLPGQFEDQKQQQMGQTLSQLLDQNYQNASQRNDLQYNQ